MIAVDLQVVELTEPKDVGFATGTVPANPRSPWPEASKSAGPSA
ncbi:unannotated protein [freshwater metagenome]|uniref:Unannotated protein n=1 Tax=freshwater metagenome TaxID=449393 RepID=A0A6J7H0L8_9ZZZZ